jgi:Acyl-CoA thioesterase C-terminal domain/Acyl-CoA thioesterase N-terminal domain
VSEDPVETFGALFERDGDRYIPTPLTRGPWDPRAMHGGAPSALFAHACETHDPGPAGFVARVTVELMRPVPLTPLALRVRTLRPGRKVQWLEAALLDADEREMARATVLRLRSAEVDTRGSVGIVADAPPPVSEAAGPPAFFGPGDVGFWSANDLRIVRGNWMEPGPGIAWLRLRCPVVAGEELSACSRVAAAADFGSGVGNPLRFAQASAINADITISMHRHPVGEWICLESGAWVHPHGVGLAETRLHDEVGPLGQAAQSLLVEPIAVRPGPGSQRSGESA